MKTKEQWLDRLYRASWREAIEEMFRDLGDDANLYPHEVLEAIMNYEGGLACGYDCSYDVMALVETIWGCTLSECEVKW